MTDVKRPGAHASAMREALEIAGIATWEWFPATDEIVLSEWMGEVSGIDANTRRPSPRASGSSPRPSASR